MALRQHGTKDRQRNPEDLALCACLSVYRGTRVASSLTHLEEFANVTSRELWYKHMERQTVAQPAKATRRFMCQGVGNVLRTSSIERNCQGQPRDVAPQDEPGRAAEEILPGDQRVQMEQEHRQHASIPEPSAIPAQSSSSSQQETMQVNTTPRRARIPEDENDTRTVRPRLEMSILISELCERDVPEIGWKKLAVDNSSVYDIYAGLSLDEAQVKAGRETEVKRMLEFHVYEEGQRGTGPWQGNLEQCLAGLTEETRTGEVEIGWSIRSEVHASAMTCLRPHHHLQQGVSFCEAASRGHGRCLGLWDVSVTFFLATIENKEHAEGQDDLETLESHVRDTGCKFTLAKVGARNIV